MTDEEWEVLRKRLRASAFRSRFHLSEKDRAYISDKGMETIERHAGDFIRKRLSGADIPNDGKQTPMKGHPVFIAQHATACCCRGCIEKWHGIRKGHELAPDEMEYIKEVIMRWIRDEMQG